MAAWFEKQNLTGFARWMYGAAQEEIVHAMKFFQFVCDRDGLVTLEAITQPTSTAPSRTRTTCLPRRSPRRTNTKSIHSLYELALKENDYATQAFLKWFLDEQVGRRKITNEIESQLALAGSEKTGILFLDDKLGRRAGGTATGAGASEPKATSRHRRWLRGRDPTPPHHRRRRWGMARTLPENGLAPHQGRSGPAGNRRHQLLQLFQGLVGLIGLAIQLRQVAAWATRRMVSSSVWFRRRSRKSIAASGSLTVSLTAMTAATPAVEEFCPTAVICCISVTESLNSFTDLSDSSKGEAAAAGTAGARVWIRPADG